MFEVLQRKDKGFEPDGPPVRMFLLGLVVEYEFLLAQGVPDALEAFVSRGRCGPVRHQTDGTGSSASLA